VAPSILGPAMAVVTLKPGHVQPVWAGHPWVYAQAVERVEGGATAGDEVDVLDGHGNFLGRGLYSPRSAIPVRLYTRQRGIAFDAGLVAQRVRRARERRIHFGLPDSTTNAFRLIHAEGDDLPGLMVDLYGDVGAVQFGTVGMKRREDLLLDTLGKVLGLRTFVDRSSSANAKTEDFPSHRGIVRGPELDELSFHERGFAYRIPLSLGQKTGFYLDQRPLRARIEQLASGRSVLDTHCYVGALSLAAARGGATSVTAIDSSALALEVGAECAANNGLGEKIQFERGDAAEVLARAGRHGGYDLVISDPPKLAPTRQSLKSAMVAVRRLAALGSRATRPGGLLVLSSCSAALGAPELARAAALGARDVGLTALVLERVFQGPDHPVPAAFPEGLYLTTLLLEIGPR
jgi:23S rRNA (cytosine1962-C5)-methyltransferase